MCTAVDPIRPAVPDYPGGEPIAGGCTKILAFVKKKDTEE